MQGHFSKISFANSDMNFEEVDGKIDEADNFLLDYYSKDVEILLPCSMDYEDPQRPFASTVEANEYIMDQMENKPLQNLCMRQFV